MGGKQTKRVRERTIYERIEIEIIDLIDRDTAGYGEPDSAVGSGEVARSISVALRIYEEQVRQIVREELIAMKLVVDRTGDI